MLMPVPAILPVEVIYPMSPEALGIDATALGIGGQTSTADWPTANMAIFYPFRLQMPFIARRLWITTGSFVGGNFDIGIYAQDGTRIVSAGSTVHAGTNSVQYVDIADTWIGPGLFYMGFTHDGGGSFDRVYRIAVTAIQGQLIGLRQQLSALPLPATATFATFSQTFVPVVGVTSRAS